MHQPRLFAEKAASYYFGRPVTIGALQISGTAPLHFDMSDVHFTNAPWGSQPDMLTIRHVSGSLALKSLLHKAPLFQQLTLDDATLVLERDDNGTGNWKKDFIHPAPHPPQNPEIGRRERPGFPTILDLAINNGHISFRTTGGKILLVDLDHVKLETPDASQPVNLAVDGAYNHYPVTLAVSTDSFDVFHDASKALGAAIDVTGGGGPINLKLQLMDPVNFDGFDGTLDIDTKNLGKLITVLGEPVKADLPLQLTGRFQRNGDDWQLGQASGSLATNPFKSNLHLKEGARLQPDALNGNLNFAHINIDDLIAKWTPPNPKNSGFALPVAEDKPDPLLNGELGAAHLTYGSLQLNDLAFHVDIAANNNSIDKISAQWAGGEVKGAVKAITANNGNEVTADAVFRKIDAQQLFSKQGKPDFLSGAIDGKAHIEGLALTLDQLLQKGKGQVLVTMQDGTLQKNIIHLASLDITSLFKNGSGNLSCLLAVGVLHDGILNVTPARMKTPEGAIFGGGTIRPQTHTIDMTFQTEPKTTGTLALDLPITLKGDLNSPAIGLGSKGAITQIKTDAAAQLQSLPASFKTLLNKSNCLN